MLHECMRLQATSLSCGLPPKSKGEETQYQVVSYNQVTEIKPLSRKRQQDSGNRRPAFPSLLCLFFHYVHKRPNHYTAQRLHTFHRPTAKPSWAVVDSLAGQAYLAAGVSSGQRDWHAGSGPLGCQASGQRLSCGRLAPSSGRNWGRQLVVVDTNPGSTYSALLYPLQHLEALLNSRRQSVRLWA